MGIFEKVKSWLRHRKKLRRQVKIYTHLRELSEGLRKAGHSQWADKIDNAFYGSTSGEILDAQAFLLRNIVKQEKLSPALKSKIRRIELEIWGLWHGLFAIASSEVGNTKAILYPSAFCSTRTDARLPLDYKRIVAHGGDPYGDFEMWKCGHCGAFALYDDEHCMIYLNPHDFSKRYLYGPEDPPNLCRHCNLPDAFKPATESDAEAVRNSVWAKFLRDGTRMLFVIAGNPNSPAEILFADYTIQAEFTDLQYDRTWRLSADTFTCSVLPENGRLVGIDAYTPPTCWIPVPELRMPETSETYQCYFSADFDSNGIAPLCSNSAKRIIWQYSRPNKVLRAVFEDRTERFYSVAPNLAIGVCDVNILSEVRFGDIETKMKNWHFDDKCLLVYDTVVATFPYAIKMAREFGQTIILILDVPPNVVFSDNAYGYVIPEKRLWQIEHNGYYPAEEQAGIVIIDFAGCSDATTPVLWSWTCFAIWVDPYSGKVIKTKFLK